MSDAEFIIWLLFLLGFIVLPIKSFFKYLFKGFAENCCKNTKPCVDEEDYGEKHYSQLYCPGDKKYHKIVKLSDNAKSTN